MGLRKRNSGGGIQNIGLKSLRTEKGVVLERWRPERSRRQPPEGTMCARGYIRSWQTERAAPTDAVAINFDARRESEL
jgi:hypothetical protein